MTSGRKPSPILYTLPHGIEVIGEHKPSARNPYWRVRIRPHPFFPNLRVISNGCDLRRSRAILASKLGRELTVDEIAHHCDEDRGNDAFGNINLLSAAEHNQHHKTGTKHRPESRFKTSASLKRLYAAGLRTANSIKNRDPQGRIAS